MAAPGETVWVTTLGAAVYNENLDFLGKAITVEVAVGAGPITISPLSLSAPIVSFVSGEGRGSVLRGFTVRGATDSPAILCTSSAPTIEDNSISQNGSVNLAQGGGILVVDAAPLVRNNWIAFNESGMSGGGLYAEGTTAFAGEMLEIEGNSFMNNKAGYQGAGMTLTAVVAARVSDNLFQAGDAGGAWPVHCDRGAAPGGGAIALVSTGNAPVSLTGNDFQANLSWQFGGAVLCVASSPAISAGGSGTFTGNNAECNGGGLAVMQGSSPSVSGYRFSGCGALVNGGGIAAMFSSDATISDCVIENGTCLGADPPNGGSENAYGGGIYIEDAAPTVQGCTITNNTARGADEAFGGGIAVVDGPDSGDASPIIRECEITQNQAHTAGGGIYSGKLPGSFGLLTQTVTVKKNIIAENGTLDFQTPQPRSGGGIAIEGGNAVIVRNTVRRNRASESGAGIHMEAVLELSALTNNMIVKNELADTFGLTVGIGAGVWFSGDVERLISNTIARNLAAPTSQAGGMFVQSGAAEVWNSILWNNAGQSDLGGNPTVFYSDVDKPAGWTSGLANFRRYPRFVAPAADDFHLSPFSPCINRGDHTVMGLSVYDIDGEARILDGRTDQGADERDLPNPILVP
jgi:hypothetical protein